MKLAILGNSHVACLKSGWDRMGGVPGLDIVFFGARKQTLSGLDIADGRLVAQEDRLLQSIRYTSGRDDIDPAEFDAFLIFGCLAKPIYVDDLAGYSRAVRAQYVRDQAARRLYYKLLGMLSQISDAPLYVGLTPLRAAPLDTQAEQGTERLQQALDMLQDTISDAFGARLVLQPPETIVNGGATAIEYASGGQRLDIGLRGPLEHEDDENIHMNAEFGEMWLRRFLSRELKIETG